MNLRNQASAIHEVPPPKSFTFLHDACRALEQARKVVAVGEAKERYAKGAEWAWTEESEGRKWRWSCPRLRLDALT